MLSLPPIALVTRLVVVLLATMAQQERLRFEETLDPGTDQWVAVEPEVDDGTPIAEARKLLVEERYSAAHEILDDWLEENGGHERAIEAHYLLGEAYFGRADFRRAHEQFEIVVDASAGDLFYKALRREMDVARAFLSGEPQIVFKILRLPAYEEGVEILDRVWERLPGTRLGEQALKLKADYYFGVGEMDLAQDSYAFLAQQYPNGRYHQLALLRAAEAASAAFPGVQFDATPLANAQERYAQLRDAYPAYAERESVDARLDAIREQRAAKAMDVARWYAKTGRDDAAAFYYRHVLETWPDTLSAPQARARLRDMGLLEEPEPDGPVDETEPPVEEPEGADKAPSDAVEGLDAMKLIGAPRAKS